MFKYFDRTFFKFLLGFVLIISVSLIIGFLLYFYQYVIKGEVVYQNQTNQQ